MNKKEIFFHLLRNREISIKRLRNVLEIALSYLIKSSKVRGYPMILMIEPTNYCNLKCPLCPTGNGSLKAPRGFMSFENYRRIIDEVGDYLLNLTLWNFGEPFLNKEIYRMIAYAKKKNIFIRISTNGHFFNSKKNIERLVKTRLDDLIISLDGASQKTFIKYRKKGNFNRVIGNIKSLVEEKKRLKSKSPFIEIQFIVMRYNEHEIPKMEKIAKEIGVDKLTLKTVGFEVDQALSKGKIKEFLPTDEKFTRYEKDGESIKRKIKIKNRCLWLWFSSVVNWDGSVVACCYDPNRKYEFGNMFKQNSFKKIWNNEKYQRFRKLILNNKKAVDVCKDCPGTLMGLTIEK